ncbi:hypothetical protein J6590_048594 [Homalodisca vitripennis]|nr:hypothetical protein J6590_048594 [Homalodisca vitripennis]
MDAFVELSSAPGSFCGLRVSVLLQLTIQTCGAEGPYRHRTHTSLRTRVYLQQCLYSISTNKSVLSERNTKVETELQKLDVMRPGETAPVSRPAASAANRGKTGD